MPKKETESNRMKEYFFDDIFAALMYIVFIVVVPFASIILQFTGNDSTMYLSYLVAGFAMTYDYLVLFKQKISKPLWTEAILASLCFVVVLVTAFVKMSLVLKSMSGQNNTLAYGFWDLLLVLVLCIMVVINFFEFGRLLKHDHGLLFSENLSNDQKLSAGAKNI